MAFSVVSMFPFSGALTEKEAMPEETVSDSRMRLV